ncbi:hypothetical protein RLOatenuis_6580 [Rickettsiales bacterium]|nr:hypothetical protein RLOatenuis_6580 [Rickettsiales bacterium]
MNPGQISIDIYKESNKKFFSPLSVGTQEQKKLYRVKNKKFIEKSIHKAGVPECEENGWEIQRKTKTGMKTPKSHDVLLEDHFWCLLHKMGYGKTSTAKTLSLSSIKSMERLARSK